MSESYSRLRARRAGQSTLRVGNENKSSQRLNPNLLNECYRMTHFFLCSFKPVKLPENQDRIALEIIARRVNIREMSICARHNSPAWRPLTWDLPSEKRCSLSESDSEKAHIQPLEVKLLTGKSASEKRFAP
jgi:hypothetical protein